MRMASVCSATLVAFCFVPLVSPSTALSLTALLTDNRDQLDGGMPLPDGPLPEVVPVLPGVELGPGNVPVIPGRLDGDQPIPNRPVNRNADRADRHDPDDKLLLSPSEQRATPGYVTLVYNPKTGNVVVNSDNPKGNKFSCIQLESIAGRFRFMNATWYPPARPDVCTAGNLFSQSRHSFLPKGDTTALQGYDMGQILPVGLSVGDLVSDLVIDGAFFKGGRLDRYCLERPGKVFVHVVPADTEPPAQAASNPESVGASDPMGQPPRDAVSGGQGPGLPNDDGPHKESSEVAPITASELQALRDELKALREAIKTLTEKTDAAQHESVNALKDPEQVRLGDPAADRPGACDCSAGNMSVTDDASGPLAVSRMPRCEHWSRSRNARSHSVCRIATLARWRSRLSPRGRVASPCGAGISVLDPRAR